MKSRIFKLLLAAALTFTCFSGLVACKSETRNNETDALVLSIEELDGVFNPFFATSGNDNEILGNIFIGLLSGSDQGEMVAGEKEPSIALAYNIETFGSKPAGDAEITDKTGYESGFYTRYTFLLKNDLKFSDGSPLTIDDVLFSYYVYLDPVYTGSTTMYSTGIYGLSKYRTQKENANINDFNANMKEKGRNRVEAIRQYTKGASLTTQIGDDIKVVKELFREELESDWKLAKSLVGEPEYEKLGLKQDWQIFLRLCGFITLKEGGNEVDWKGWDNKPTIPKDENSIINIVYETKTDDNDLLSLNEIVTYWGTATKAADYFTADEISKYYDENKLTDGTYRYKNVAGITAHRDFEGTNHPTVTTFKDIDGKTHSLSKPHEMLEIIVNGVDPKAIYNFSVPVSPMKHYSTDALIAKQVADPDNYFGVDFSKFDTFMNKTIKAQTVPIGAGPYQASSLNHKESTEVAYTDFFTSDGIVYLMRNNNFLLGPAKIKYLNYQEYSRSSVYNALIKEQIYFAEVDAKATTIDNLNKSKTKKTFTYEMTDSRGYGYIGINAKYVNDLNVRRAIMYSMDTARCLDYYKNGIASLLHRGVSKTSWTYKLAFEDATSRYPFDKSAGYKTIVDELKKGGYTINASSGKMEDITGKQLKLTYSIAGETDHPMLSTFYNSQIILNSLGCDISVNFEVNALSKLASGQLEVWAAAWSSTIDPDTYQVYHKNSNASAVLGWGYDYILEKGSNTELTLLDEISRLTDKGRTILSNDDKSKRERAGIYREVLDKVMDLAVELPTYQRKDLYVYNKKIIDEKSLSKVTPFQSPISEIWNVSYKNN